MIGRHSVMARLHNGIMGLVSLSCVEAVYEA
jgi:hypothetical protein